jgi:hypothetical protein
MFFSQNDHAQERNPGVRHRLSKRPVTRLGKERRNGSESNRRLCFVLADLSGRFSRTCTRLFRLAVSAIQLGITLFAADASNAPLHFFATLKAQLPLLFCLLHEIFRRNERIESQMPHMYLEVPRIYDASELE